MTTRTGHLNRGRMVLAAVLLAAVASLSLGAGPGQAATCDTTWTANLTSDWSLAGNWTNGVPDNTKNACINGNGPVEITGESDEAKSLALSGAELDVQGNPSQPGTLTLDADSSIDSSGSIVLGSTCVSACHNGANLTIFSSGTLTNNGTISAEPGADQGTRALNGNIINASTGTIDVQAPLDYGTTTSGKLDNHGTIDLLHSQPLTVPFGVTKAIINDTGGTINNGGGAGLLAVGADNTFNQGAGTTIPATVNPANPAVIVDGSNIGALLKYTGSGASAIRVQNTVSLTGNIARGQKLIVKGLNSAPCSESVLTSGKGFTNAGTITLTGPCESGLKITAELGSITNTGTIVTAPGAMSRELNVNLLNRGLLDINGPTAFDGSGREFTQWAGKTTISPGQVLDLTGSAGDLLLYAGLLQSPGSSPARPGAVTGSVRNAGANVAPGTPTSPGDMAISGSYVQLAHGKLTAVIAGTKVGKTYSQLAVGDGSQLGGTLNIVTHTGFHPGQGQLFTVLGGSADAGKFGRLLGQFPPGGVGYKPHYDAQDVTLQGVAYAKLTVKRAGSAQGTVTSAPKGINCGTTCSASFFKPQTVTLTEHPTSGHKFKGWSGACTGKTTTCKVKMTKAKTVTATFS